MIPYLNSVLAAITAARPPRLKGNLPPAKKNSSNNVEVKPLRPNIDYSDARRSGMPATGASVADLPPEDAVQVLEPELSPTQQSRRVRNDLVKSADILGKVASMFVPGSTADVTAGRQSAWAAGSAAVKDAEIDQVKRVAANAVRNSMRRDPEPIVAVGEDAAPAPEGMTPRLRSEIAELTDELERRGVDVSGLRDNLVKRMTREQLPAPQQDVMQGTSPKRRLELAGITALAGLLGVDDAVVNAGIGGFMKGRSDQSTKDFLQRTADYQIASDQEQQLDRQAEWELKLAQDDISAIERRLASKEDQLLKSEMSDEKTKNKKIADMYQLLTDPKSTKAERSAAAESLSELGETLSPSLRALANTEGSSVTRNNQNYELRLDSNQINRERLNFQKENAGEQHNQWKQDFDLRVRKIDADIANAGANLEINQETLNLRRSELGQRQLEARYTKAYDLQSSAVSNLETSITEVGGKLEGARLALSGLLKVHKEDPRKFGTIYESRDEQIRKLQQTVRELEGTLKSLRAAFATQSQKLSNMKVPLPD